MEKRTPHLDPYASGTFIGIRQNTSQADFVRAVLEGVAFSLRDCYELLPKQNYHIRISGGGAKGKLWRTIIASVLKEPVERIVQDEGGAIRCCYPSNGGRSYIFLYSGGNTKNY